MLLQSPTPAIFKFRKRKLKLDGLSLTAFLLQNMALQFNFFLAQKG